MLNLIALILKTVSTGYVAAILAIILLTIL